jgi:hypothetical protein
MPRINSNSYLSSDVIDHEPIDGTLYKMILGSVDEKYDNDQAPLGSDSRNPRTPGKFAKNRLSTNLRNILG